MHDVPAPDESTLMSSQSQPISPNSTPLPSSHSAPSAAGMAIGVACIILGGLIAAITGPLQLEKGSWVSAYLVLVAGVIQYALAIQEKILDAPQQPVGRLWTRNLLWTAGNAVVILGAFTDLQFFVGLGGLALIAVLVMCLLHTKGARRQGLAWLARALYLVVVLSVPVGLVLTQR